MPKIYKVGGAVRDAILGIDSKDIDFTFVLDELDQTVEEGFQKMDDWMTENGFEVFLRVPEMYTIRARFPKGDPNEKLVADFVMARKEMGYSDDSRRPVLKLGTLDDDLIRRDFTINAMAEDEDGDIIDLFGGQEDLRIGILRTPKHPDITFYEDPLRLLRALRFVITKDLVMCDGIWEAMKNPELLKKLELTVSGERIREEIAKMMKQDTVRAIRLLTDCDDHMGGKLLNILFKNGLWLKPTFEQ
jgi:tRNA nucleotidyltransferase/poly(A) polymerase